MKTYLDRTAVPVDAMLFEASLAAMQGLIANRGQSNSPEHVAVQSVRYARALLKELANTESGDNAEKK